MFWLGLFCGGMVGACAAIFVFALLLANAAEQDPEPEPDYFDEDEWMPVVVAGGSN